ncbi:hypothetical protein [Burkholderia multivorans]|uniref:hypothetical protein n=1 Tax=Burkholderia multivorans TaxID=87883 RepID=UPI0021C0C361|nr:hypothetical protein [Burkholderia multivorans]
MIDQDKMRALAKCLRADADFAGERESGSFDLRYEAADAIDLLLAEVEAAAALVQDVSKQKPERPDYWSSCSQCEHNIDRAQDLLEKQAALSQRQEES